MSLRKPWFLAAMFGVLAIAVSVLATQTEATRTSDETGKVLGLAFVGRQVGDLDKSIAYYKTLGFSVTTDASAWTADPAENRLYKTAGAQYRTAILTLPSSASGKPLRLYLREYRGVERKNLNLPIYDVGVGHIGVAAEDPRAFWEHVKAEGQLRPKTGTGDLAATQGGGGGFGTMADPDGMIVEERKPKAASPATGAMPAMPADKPGFSHFGLVVADMVKSEQFYNDLSGVFPSPREFGSGRGAREMWNLPDGDNRLRVVYGTLLEANAAPGTRFYFELVEFQDLGKKDLALRNARISDIGVNYLGFQVTGLQPLYSKLKTDGAEVLSDGTVALKDGTRAIVVRDPDSGLFLELLESPKK